MYFEAFRIKGLLYYHLFNESISSLRKQFVLLAIEEIGKGTIGFGEKRFDAVFFIFLWIGLWNLKA